MILEITLIAGAAAAGLATAELLARVHLKRKAEWFVHAPRSRTENRLHASAFPRLPQKVRIQANREGERGGELPRPPEQLYRVLVAGGSAAECYMLDQANSWPMVTEQILNGTAGRRRLAHVGNMACSLMPCRSVTPLIEKVLPRLRSVDVVVLMVGASDLVDWFERETPAQIANKPAHLQLFCSEHPGGRFTWKPSGTALYRVCRRLKNRVLRPIDRNTDVGASRLKHRKMRATCQNMLTESPDPAPLLESFRFHLTALIRSCETNAATVLLARQPWLDTEVSAEQELQLWNFGQGSPFRMQPEAYYSTKVVRKLMLELDRVAQEVAQAEGVASLDLRPEVPSDLDHYYDYLHHTPLGAQCIGAAVASKLTELEADQPNLMPCASGRSSE